MSDHNTLTLSLYTTIPVVVLLLSDMTIDLCRQTIELANGDLLH